MSQEILLVRLGEQRIAFLADSVARIASPAAEPAAHWMLQSALGRARRPGRGLVARHEDEERVLAVDAIETIGLQHTAKIHPLPLLARDTLGTRGVEGLVEMDEQLIWLVDLQELFEERRMGRPQEVESDAK